MQDPYFGELDEYLTDLVLMSKAVTAAVRDATVALLNSDIRLAEQVISDPEITEARSDLESRAFVLMALHAPVASDLRMLVAGLRVVADLERMGALAAHIAAVARMRYPDSAIPAPVRPGFVRMGDIADKMVAAATDSLDNRSTDSARELFERDKEMDDLRRQQFQLLLGTDWPHGVEAAVDVTLLGRYYERIADHATSVARRVVYIVTGEFPDSEEIRPEPH